MLSRNYFGACNSEFSLSVAKLLLSRGANPNVGDFQGKTPLHHAIEKQDLPFIDLLLKYGANLRQPNNAGQTPFALALKSWNLRIVNMCLLGFDPYAEDEV
jgi:ankyrin repeat protein